MYRTICCLLLAVLAAPAAACSGHPWFRAAPPGINAEHISVLYLPARPDHREEAIAMLDDKKGRRITPAQAAALTGEDERSWVPGMTYLLRGLRYDNPQSQFGVVYSDAGEVVVYFGMKGEAKRGPYEAPMVAVLPVQPTVLYVTCNLVP